MLSHVQTTAPLAFEVGTNAHRRVPLSGPVLPRSQLQQRKAALFGLSSGQVARSVAIMAMAPLLAEDAPEQSSGAAGEYAKLQVRAAHPYFLLKLRNEAHKAEPSRHCARSWTRTPRARLSMWRTASTRSRGCCSPTSC